MSCEYCDRERSTTYTIDASITGTDATLEFDFCSRDCLAAWASPAMDYGSVTVNGQRV